MFPDQAAGTHAASQPHPVPWPPAGAVTAVRSRWELARSQVRAQLAADPAVPGRRGLQLCLGLIWLLDAALQYQPFMFRPSFVTTIIAPAAAGNPGFVTATVGWASRLMLHQVAVSNAVFATVQLLIAAGLFFRRTVRPALVLSIAWAVSVWWLGESLGGILAGLSPLAGLPGAALLYALIAVLAWPSPPGPAGPPMSVAACGPAGAAVAKIAWLALWGSFAHYLLLPANRAAGAESALLADTDGQPGWLSAVMSGLSRAADQRGLALTLVLAILCAGTALAMLAAPLIRPALVLAAAFGVVLCITQGWAGYSPGREPTPVPDRSWFCSPPAICRG